MLRAAGLGGKGFPSDASGLISRPARGPVAVDRIEILADGASALVGGLGIAPNACIGDNYAYFGSVHGTAPDIVGLNVINPTAMILGAAMMLDYLGFADASAKLESAVRQTYARGECLTRDQGGTASTTEFCDYVARLSV